MFRIKASYTDQLELKTTLERASEFFGEFRNFVDLMPNIESIRKEAGGIRLTGYAAALAEQGPTRGPQNVFINRRIVKDRTIAHAIIDAYSQASIKERREA